MKSIRLMFLIVAASFVTQGLKAESSLGEFKGLVRNLISGAAAYYASTNVNPELVRQGAFKIVDQIWSNNFLNKGHKENDYAYQVVKLAHEFLSITPGAVTAVKTAADANGGITGKLSSLVDSNAAGVSDSPEYRKVKLAIQLLVGLTAYIASKLVTNVVI